MDGQTPLSVMVDVFSGATDGLVGRVKPDFETHDLTPRVLRNQLVAVVLGAMSHGEPQLDVMAWPIDPDSWREGSGHDARHAKFICEWLGLDQVDWGHVLHTASERAKDKRFRHLVRAIATDLERVGELHQPELIEIARKVDNG